MLPCHGNDESSILSRIVNHKQLWLNCKPYSQTILMTKHSSAFESIKDSYDLDTLREIRDHGCSSGVATSHIYYTETVPFFDNYEEEIVETVSDTLGDDYLVEVFTNSSAQLTSYKNDIVWTFVELVAMQIIDEFEDTTQEELSNLDDNVYSNLVELSNTEWGKNHLEIVTP